MILQNQMQEQDNKGNIGPLVGIIIVILMLVIGAFYFYNQSVEKQKEIQKITQQEQVTNEEDIVSIENDAKTLNFDDLGEGIDQI
jgi:biopolymer transport protein ExbD